MPRPLLVSIIAIAAFVLVACSGSDQEATAPKPFCEAAYNLDQAVGSASPARQLELVSAVANTAPPEVKADAETFRAALEQQVQAGAVNGTNIPDAERKKIETAANNVNRYAIQRCGLLKQNRR